MHSARGICYSRRGDINEVGMYVRRCVVLSVLVCSE